MLDIPFPLLADQRPRSGPSSRPWPVFMPRLSMILAAKGYAGCPVLQPSADREVPRARSIPVTSPTRSFALWNRPPTPRSAGDQPKNPAEPFANLKAAIRHVAGQERLSGRGIVLSPAWRSLYDQLTDRRLRLGLIWVPEILLGHRHRSFLRI